jgi:hypothetical protein
MGEGRGEGVRLIHKNQDSGVLGGFDHILKLFIRRIGRFEFGVHVRHRFQKAQEQAALHRIIHILRQRPARRQRHRRIQLGRHDADDVAPLSIPAKSFPHPVFDHPLPSDGRWIVLCPPSPKPSPQGEGFHVPRASKNSRDWICRTANGKNRNAQLQFLLPGGEGRDEGGRKTKFFPCRQPFRSQLISVAPSARKKAASVSEGRQVGDESINTVARGVWKRMRRVPCLPPHLIQTMSSPWLCRRQNHFSSLPR